jgi:sugar O-acyltransferase (sialic acid O-acetyltransferase NeuD family)
MLIVGAKGFAKEILEAFENNIHADKIAFYDDVNDHDGKLFEKFNILKTEESALDFFKTNGNEFSLGAGNPFTRYKLYKKFMALGGRFCSGISSNAITGKYNVVIGEGCNILPNAVISNDVSLGKGCIVYYNAVITHDCRLGDFVEVSPSVNLLGRVSVGSFSQIGAGAVVLPDVIIGKNVVIGAGAVVTENIKDNSVAAGVPAKIIKELPAPDAALYE